MSAATPSIEDLIFWSEDLDRNSDVRRDRNDEELHIDEETLDSDKKGKEKGLEGQPSQYVKLCEDMINTVLEDESFLFSESELVFFNAFRALSYNARYLFVRLLMRKANKWHRLSALKYTSEIGPPSAISGVIEELCASFPGRDAPVGHIISVKRESIKVEVKSEAHDVETIDLTLDDGVFVKTEERTPTLPGSEMMAGLSHTDNANGVKTEVNRGSEYVQAEDLAEDMGDLKIPTSLFAEDESSASLPDLLGCLTVDELKKLAKAMRIKVHSNRTAIIDALLLSAASQSTLHDFAQPRSQHSRLPSQKSACDSAISGSQDAVKKQLKQLVLPFRPLARKRKFKTQTDVLRDRVMETLSKCIRLNSAVYPLFKRLNIVYFRSTQYPTSILTEALLARFRKRFYPTYTFARTASIFPSRGALLAYESALAIAAEVEELDGSTPASARGRPRAASSRPVLKPRWKTSGMATEKENANASPERSQSEPGPQNDANVNGEHDDGQPSADDPKESRQVVSARRVLSIFERVYPHWQELVEIKGGENERDRGLERFDEGWVLTRVVAKGAHALGTLKEYDREVQVLEELLAQRRWRRGKRGAWYERLALVLMHHLARRKLQDEDDTRKTVRARTLGFRGEAMLEKAIDVVIRGLEDPDTHMVYRPALERRLTLLEKRLKILQDERHQSERCLQKAKEIQVPGDRIRHRSSSIALDRTGRVVNHAKISLQSMIHGLTVQKPDMPIKAQNWQGKTIWRGDNREEVNVETYALQYYARLGYKGFHSEGRVVSTIFGLLFWDVIFASVPGAFETRYQSAPLDITHDSFYRARADIIEKRLTEIEAGCAIEILEAVDDRHRPNRTMCVGVHWKTFEKGDLMEIVEYLGGRALSAICRLFCEDYMGRASGLPDLLIWNSMTSDCKFVEVKGPGDTLQENQRVWIDALMQSGVAVEVCRVYERGTTGENGGKRKRSEGKGKKAKHKAKVRAISPNEDEGDNGLYVDSGNERNSETSGQNDDENSPTEKRRRTEAAYNSHRRGRLSRQAFRNQGASTSRLNQNDRSSSPEY